MKDLFVISPTERTGATKFTLEQIEDFGLSGLSVPSDDRLSLSAAYAQVGWFKRCIDVRARSVAGLPWAIYGARSSDPVWTDDSAQPGSLAWLAMRDALYTAEVSLALFGAAYALKERSGRTMTGLYWYNAGTVKPEWRGTDIVRFKRRVGTKDEYLAPEDVIAVFVSDAVREIGPGNPDALAALIHAQVLHDLAGYTSEQLRSGLIKRTVFTSDGRRPPDDEAKRVEAWLSRWLLGRNKTDVKVMSGNLKPVEIGSSLADLAAREIEQAHREAIATTLGVPHSLVMSNAANYATAVADQLGFYLTTVIPEARTIQDAMNAHLFNRMGLELQFEPDRSEVIEQQQAQSAQAVVALYTAGVLTLDEVRAQLGYEPSGTGAASTAAENDNDATTPDAGSTPAGSTDDDDTAARALDLKRWRTKVERRGRGVKFAPDAIEAHEADVIRERLARGEPLDDAYAPPFLPSF